KSFLYYIPYAVLTAMTIPAVFYATKSTISATVGLITAVIVSMYNKSLTFVAACACLSVFIAELIIKLIG
ncbi:MAG: AzlD domain-containing protein, partial [Lachnospiraceae bacterium]|nr:AzlD domain-containing protein [Lachnospiraceae bacterium]